MLRYGNKDKQIHLSTWPGAVPNIYRKLAGYSIPSQAIFGLTNHSGVFAHPLDPIWQLTPAVFK